MSKDAGSIPCPAIEELLRAEALDALGDLERSRLEHHLRRCASCRAYRRLLQRFHTALAPTDGQRPDPAGHDRLRQAVRRRRRSGSLAGLLRRPIPVYQALLGAAAAVFLLLAAELLRSDEPPPAASPTLPRDVEHARIDSYEVLAKLKLLDAPSRGWRHTEDSLLIRFPITNLQPADSI
jgi:hypothetical protein